MTKYCANCQDDVDIDPNDEEELCPVCAYTTWDSQARWEVLVLDEWDNLMSDL
jgi:hypothetical protein